MLQHGIVSGRTGPALAIKCLFGSVWCALLLAVVLFQASVVQSHVHTGLDSQADAAALVFASDIQNMSDAPDDSSGSLSDCFLCSEANLSGRYLLPEAQGILSNVTLGLAVEAQDVLGLLLPRNGVGWLGRAPPQ